ncbi:MAG: phosphotransacetylase family protein [Chloroflexi bacterium]|nr:phosphotransacetylase family protein [Chloroflexota bacterium]
MATSLYVVSTETFSGKSALCVGLGRKLITDGFKVAYMKPVSVARMKLEREIVDEDSALIGEILGLHESADQVCPILLTSRLVKTSLGGEKPDYPAKLTKVFEQVSNNKDVVILEGANNWTEGAIVDLRAKEIADLLKSKVVVVAHYHSPLVVDRVMACHKDIDARVVGVVINEVPFGEMETATNVVKPYLENVGIKVLGILPQDSVLGAITVGELAFHLSGRLLCCEEKTEDLVENLTIGAMTLESALREFRRVPSKAVITGGDRTDIIFAALETSTKVLVLTGNLYPNPVVISRAEEHCVPIILVPHSTFEAVEIIEQFFGRSRFHHKPKVDRFQTMLDSAFDFETLYQALGLKGK